MKQVLFMLLFTATLRGYSQDIQPFQVLRFDEDYSFLQYDTSINWYKRIKFTPLSNNKKTFASYGGDIRFQYFYTRNEGWGDVPEDQDGYILARVLAHADVHVGKKFRTFVQLQSSLSGSRVAPSAVDENPLEVHQAFVDIKTNPSRAALATFRLGRQEFLYGSQRLITVREGPNNRQSFDAIRSLLITDNYKVDLFYGYYVKARKKIFDDAFNKNIKIWGAYVVKNKLPILGNIDFYYLGIWKRQAVFDDGQGKELRHSIGARIWDTGEGWSYDIEGLYQFGQFAGKTISAWTSSVNTSYRFSRAKLNPVIGLKTEFVSGDKRYDETKLQTFNPMFPRGAYFGLAALIGPANLIDIHPFVALSIIKKMELGFDYDIFWRYSCSDGLYRVDGTLIYSGRNNFSRYLGGQSAVNLTFIPNKYLIFTAEFTWFDAGDFIKSAGAGKDILFTGLAIQLKF